MSYQTLDITREGSVEHVTLNRPEVRNAFNPTLIAELHDWAKSAAASNDLRAAVLSGGGKAFSAGADLGWMAESVAYSRERNEEDARQMAEMFDALNNLPMPLIGKVHGAALGGGAGLVAVCDIVVAEEATTFGFTEVKLGLLPAVISPYVIAKIGRSAARRVFLTGARFDAIEARQIGLVHAIAASEQLGPVVAGYLKEILAAGPEAVRASKRLIQAVASAGPLEDLRKYTVSAIAERRVSAEGQEGIRAFLEKRTPNWSK